MKKSTILAMLGCFRSTGSGEVSARRCSGLRCLQYALWLLGALLFVMSSAQAGLKGGDILALEQGGVLFVVNPRTGHRRVLTDLRDLAQGPRSLGSAGVAVGATGPIYVSDFTAGSESKGAILAVDRDTGQRSLVSDFGQGNVQGFVNYGLAVDASGRPIVTVAHYGPTIQTNFLVRVNPQNNHSRIVSDFHNPTQGEMCSSDDPSQVYCFIVGLTFQHVRKIFVATNVSSAVPGQVTSKILRVNAVTGERIPVTDFDNPAQGADTGELLHGGILAVEASGHLLASFLGSRERRWNLLFRIDPRTGNRKVLSNFDNRAQGTRGMYPYVAVEASGQILAFALPYFDDGQTQVNEKGALFRVDPRTGKRAVVSNFNNAAQGQKSTAPVVYIAVVPTAPRPRGVAERADECPAAETGPAVASDGCNRRQEAFAQNPEKQSYAEEFREGEDDRRPQNPRPDERQ